MPITGTPASTVPSIVFPGRNTFRGGSIKPSFLELPGKLPIKWTVWVAMFSDHQLAYDLDSIAEVRKKAILRSSLGVEGYHICMDLSPKAKVTINTLLTRLGNRFALKESVFYARSVFHRQCQSCDKQCMQFVIALRSV